MKSKWASHLMQKKKQFWGQQKFLAEWLAGGAKIWKDEKNLLV
jgi:hypothetical protein